MRRILVSIFAVILTLSATRAQTNSDGEKIQKINAYLTQLEEVGFHGSVLVELNGEKVSSKGYGFSNLEEQHKNTPNTVFDIGSITKQFTAFAILKLEMQGKLSTDDKITEYFKNVPEDKENITLHDLLRHQSGLTSNVGRDYEKISEEEFVSKVLSTQLGFEVGTDFSYSNVGYSLLAIIVEKVSGQTYETYLYENLWKPAQMEMTGYSRPAFNTNIIATGYYYNDSIWGKPTDMEWDGPAPYWHLKGNGGILSTTEDLYKWSKVLKTDLVLSREAIQKLTHPKLRPGETEDAYYAYGWDVLKTDRQTTRLWHNGSNRIFYADFMIYINEGTTLIMLSNKSHPNFNNLNFEISRIIFNQDFEPEIPVIDNKENRDFTNQILKTINADGLEKAKSVYASRKSSKNLLGFVMREEGFNALDNEETDLALQIFEMHAHAYPKSAKALQDLGEWHMNSGNKDLALKYFRSSLNISPDNLFASDMIKELEK